FLHHLFLHLYFFFQAEDGIRDFHVTGVQTCALPIWGPATGPVLFSDYEEGGDRLRSAGRTPGRRPRRRRSGTGTKSKTGTSAWRSEERRVGKECRTRRAR